MICFKRWGAAIGAGLVLASAFAALRFQGRPPVPPAPLMAEAPKGRQPILGLRWGMSPDAVEKALPRPLEAPRVDPLFYRLVDADESADYRILETPVSYAGRDGFAKLLFRKEKLSAYFIFLEDRERDEIDADILATLKQEFGEKPLSPEDEGGLRAIWSLEDVDVNYWLIFDELRLIPAHRAAIGVRHKNEE